MDRLQLGQQFIIKTKMLCHVIVYARENFIYEIHWVLTKLQREHCKIVFSKNTAVYFICMGIVLDRGKRNVYVHVYISVCF